MTAIELLREKLGLDGLSAPLRKTSRPANLAFVDIHACTGCGLCVTACPTLCIESLANSKAGRGGTEPVQIRYQECIGCGLCVEICQHLAQASAIRNYDTNLVEQALSCKIGAEAPQIAGSVEPLDEYWAEEGSFHHMGERASLRLKSLTDTELAVIEGARLPHG